MSQDPGFQLDQIRAEIIQHNVCPNLAKTAKHLVFGEGNPRAQIVFIGEAPGRQEDETGRPFIGAAGKFLDELLESIGLKREDVYITSILKYRPPNNRDPRPEEKDAFWPYLEAQLTIIQPVLVVTLGRHSLNCFLPMARIGAMHGQVQAYKEWTILPLYHPAAALYNSSMRQTLLDDFSRIPETLKTLISQ
jgi:uracil-DNA glycosylase family 4